MSSGDLERARPPWVKLFCAKISMVAANARDAMTNRLRTSGLVLSGLHPGFVPTQYQRRLSSLPVAKAEETYCFPCSPCLLSVFSATDRASHPPSVIGLGGSSRSPSNPWGSRSKVAAATKDRSRLNVKHRRTKSGETTPSSTKRKPENSHF